MLASLVQRNISPPKTQRFGGRENSYNETRSEKKQQKSEEQQRRTLFVNLRLRNAIMVDDFKHMQPTIHNDQCPICQYSFNATEKMSGLCCGHAFHAKCLRESFQIGLQDEHQTCPICDVKIVQKIEWAAQSDIGSSHQIGIGEGTGPSEMELRGSLGGLGSEVELGPLGEGEGGIEDAIGNTDEGEPDEDREGDVTGADL